MLILESFQKYRMRRMYKPNPVTSQMLELKAFTQNLSVLLFGHIHITKREWERYAFILMSAKYRKESPATTLHMGYPQTRLLTSNLPIDISGAKAFTKKQMEQSVPRNKLLKRFSS